MKSFTISSVLTLLTAVAFTTNPEAIAIHKRNSCKPHTGGYDNTPPTEINDNKSDLIPPVSESNVPEYVPEPAVTTGSIYVAEEIASPMVTGKDNEYGQQEEVTTTAVDGLYNDAQATSSSVAGQIEPTGTPPADNPADDLSLEGKTIHKAGSVEYVVDYGENEYQVTGENAMKFNILAPTPEFKDGQGTRIRTINKFSSGRFCGDVKTFSTEADGPVFAMYLADGPPPKDRDTASWHEIDFEWRNKFPNEYWTNYYYGTLAGTGGDNRGTSTPISKVKATTIGEFHRYCIEWHKDGKAIWTIQPSGTNTPVTVREENIKMPWKEMYGYISMWAGETNGWNGDMSKFTKPGTSEIKNIEFTAL